MKKYSILILIRQLQVQQVYLLLLRNQLCLEQRLQLLIRYLPLPYRLPVCLPFLLVAPVFAHSTVSHQQLLSQNQQLLLHLLVLLHYHVELGFIVLLDPGFRLILHVLGMFFVENESFESLQLALILCLQGRE